MCISRCSKVYLVKYVMRYDSIYYFITIHPHPVLIIFDDSMRILAVNFGPTVPV